MHAECFALLNASLILSMNGRQSETLERSRLCFKGNMALMNIPFPHEITSCNNTALLPKDILIHTAYTQPRDTHTPSYTYIPAYT